MAKSLRYPLATLEKESDYLFMTIEKYKPAGFDGDKLRQRLSRGLGNTRATTVASIILPIPTTITDSNGISWGSGTLNAFERAGLEGIGNVIKTNNAGDFVKEIGKLLGDVAGSVVDENNQPLAQSAIAAKILGNFGSNIGFDQVLARKTGQALNPNMELLFNGPTLRQFNFDFQFAPRSDKEAREIKEIIRTIKIASAPKLDGGPGGAFIKTPDIFQITYKKGSGDHPFLNSFKPMALTTMNVNYTASGTYATYDDGTPVAMSMSLAFQELAPIYADDYKTAATNGVGY
jgi:hypothetical protein